MRFCFVTTFYPPYSFGGDGVFVHRLAHALAARGHTVDVVHSVDAYRLQESHEPSPQFAQHPNVRVHALRTTFPRLSSLLTHQTGSPAVYARALHDVLDTAPHDVIHFHNTSLMGAPNVLGYGDAVKLYTAHEYWLVCPTHTLFTFDREACGAKRCLRCSLHAQRPPQLWRHSSRMQSGAGHIDRFLMPSKFARDRHITDGITGEFSVLPHFVPAPEVATSQGAINANPYFLVVGRLEKLKGIQDVIPVFRDYGHARLVIVGNGNYVNELRALAAGATNIEFRGFVHPSEMSALYRDAIAVIAPSLCYETFFLVGAEAMMHGTPVIARRIGALYEMITESGGGLMFDTANTLKEAMERLQSDLSLRTDLGRRGKEAALSKWTLDKHLDEYFAIIEQVRGRRTR